MVGVGSSTGPGMACAEARPRPLSGPGPPEPGGPRRGPPRTAPGRAALEAQRIHITAVKLEHVAARLSHQPGGLDMQQLVHLGHVGLHGPHRPTGPAVKPRLLDQPVRAHRLARVGHQACQEPAPLALRRSMTPADPTTSNEPKDPKLHRHRSPARRSGRRPDVIGGRWHRSVHVEVPGAAALRTRWCGGGDRGPQCPHDRPSRATRGRRVTSRASARTGPGSPATHSRWPRAAPHSGTRCRARSAMFARHVARTSR
jgi:hypothetical protein